VAGLPIPEGRIVVGLDGGYVRNWEDRTGNFELIVGRSMPEDRSPRYFGLVHGYDPKPKRRLFELLKEQATDPFRFLRLRRSARAINNDLAPPETHQSLNQKLLCDIRAKK
jgi:hypothetical protein